MIAKAPSSDRAPDRAPIASDQAASPGQAKQDGGVLQAVDRVIADLRRGTLALVHAEGAVLLIQAAEAVTPQSLERLATLSGQDALLVVTGRRAAALGLDPKGATVMALDIPEGTPAQSVRDIADPSSTVPFRLPPAQALDAPLAESAAAAVRLAKLARLLPAVLIARLDGPQGSAGGAAAWARDHDLLAVDASAVTEYEMRAARSLKPVSQARVPLFGAESARIVAYRPSDGGIEHLAIIIGEPTAKEPVLIRLHSECFTGDLLGSLRCDCGDQLRGAIGAIAEAGSGVLIYLAQEGRGIGLVNKLRAYQLQDAGADTIDANEQLGFDADERVYMPAAQILRDLGFDRVRLLTNNPEKVAALKACGIDVVERVSHAFPATEHNKAYLETKAKRSGHLF